LNSDAQIRDHSRFESMAEVMEYVLESFSRAALTQAKLVIKNHPLDVGLSDHRGALAALVRRFDLGGRVIYLESGKLEFLVEHARGVVTVNSTVGSVALGLDCPTITLSDPIYNLPGLTFQEALDDFWRQGEAPNRELFRRFRNAVIHCTQVNGGFYCAKGIDLAVRNSVAILENEISPLESLM
jgi:capsular polysaccharide export protein